MTETATLQRRQIPLDDLKIDFPGWVNPRTFTGLSEDALDELGENIKRNKIEIPPSVVRVKHKGGEVSLVIDGQRRVLAARRVFAKDTRIEVIDLSDEAIDPTPENFAKLLSRALNIGNNREGLSSYELSQAAETLRAQGIKIVDIARSLNRSETWVSKMLKARGEAINSVMLAWKKGDITDEMFKDIAALDKDQQQQALNAARATRESGDKAGARNAVKEQVEIKRKEQENKRTENDDSSNDKAPSLVKPDRKHAPVVKGPQEDLFDKTEKKDDKPSAPKPVAPSRAVLEDLVRMGEKKPPTHEYVKGIMAGVSYALGFTNPEKFANPFVVYLRRFEGQAVPNPRRGAAKGKAKPAQKSKAKKPAKKSGKKSRR